MANRVRAEGFDPRGRGKDRRAHKEGGQLRQKLRSGLIYQSVVEVARYDPATHEVVIGSGWGGRTDWYRNIQAEPALEIRIGRERFVPEQRLLNNEETYQEIVGFARRNPWEGRMMRRLFGIDLAASEETARAQVAAFFKGVSFRPRRTA